MPNIFGPGKFAEFNFLRSRKETPPVKAARGHHELIKSAMKTTGQSFGESVNQPSVNGSW